MLHSEHDIEFYYNYYMDNYKFIKTEDGSTGLYSNIVEDIFHSKTGALKEAYDKFIIPSKFKEKIKENKKTKVLDICTGIGYNLKAALSCIENENVSFDCIDIDKTLIMLSPFIQDGINDDLLNLHIFSELLINNFRIEDIAENFSEYFTNSTRQFFKPNISKIIDFVIKSPYKLNHPSEISSLLHNIYYNYISCSMSCSSKSNKYPNIKINYVIDDARRYLLSTDSVYDFVFLDAFSPQKAPELWTIDFLNQIKLHMNNNSILVSYSKSTPFRSALVELGFFVGKTFIENEDMGTIASFNKSLIVNALNDFDIKLIKTRSGITYKDTLLNLSSSEIIKNREIEQKNSTRISHTQFLKLNSNL